MALSDERLKRMIRSVEEGEMDPDDMHEALLELLAIRERITIEPVVLREANRRTLQGLLEWAVYGDGAQAPTVRLTANHERALHEARQRAQSPKSEPIYADPEVDHAMRNLRQVIDGMNSAKTERLYSEEKVRALLNALNEQMRPGDYIDIEAAMRRLRGEGEAKPVCPNCRQPLAPSAIAKTRWVCNNEHCARGHISASEVGVDP